MNSSTQQLGFIELIKNKKKLDEKAFEDFAITNVSDEEISNFIESIKDDISSYQEPINNRNILMLFIRFYKKKWIDILFDKINAEQKSQLFKHQDKKGQSAIHYATREYMDDEEFVLKLICSDSNNTVLARNEDGDNIALLNAANMPNTNVIDLLITLGMPVSNTIYNLLPSNKRFYFSLSKAEHALKNPEFILTNLKKLNYVNPVDFQNEHFTIAAFENFIITLLSLPHELVKNEFYLAFSFIDDKIINWKLLSLNDQNILKQIILKLYKEARLELFLNYEVDKQIVLSLLRFAEICPEALPATADERLVHLIHESNSYLHPMAIDYLKRIEHKNRKIECMLFYIYAQRTGDYNATRALENGEQFLLSDEYIPTYQIDKLFSDHLELLRQEKKAKQAFDLADSLSNKTYLFNLDHVFALILLAAELNYEPAIEELKKINFENPTSTQSNYRFWDLKFDDRNKAKELLVRLGVFPDAIKTKPNPNFLFGSHNSKKEFKIDTSDFKIQRKNTW